VRPSLTDDSRLRGALPTTDDWMAVQSNAVYQRTVCYNTANFQQSLVIKLPFGL
jgi:hypothetical protein